MTRVDLLTQCAMFFSEYSQGIRTDASMVPPIRQTASIFKQPVTVHNNQKSKVNQELEQNATSEKPRQLFWEKRLEVIYFDYLQ